MVSRRSGRALWISLGLVVVVLVGLLTLQSFGSGTLSPLGVITVPAIGGVPVMATKPPASPEGLNGCPPEGEGGDPDLNRLMNRVDKGAYLEISFDSLLALTWPKSVEHRLMSEWTPSGRAFISQYLGTPVVVDGYIDALREFVGAPANCNRIEEQSDLWRLSLTSEPKDRRHEAVMATITPQGRIGHAWTTHFIRDVLVAGRVPVRVSGWLYFDADHPQEIGRTRATLWEISPVMQIEVFEDGRWNPLDSYGRGKPTKAVP